MIKDLIRKSNLLYGFLKPKKDKVDNFIFRIKYREKKVGKGNDFADKVFSVIYRVNRPETGIFSNILVFLQFLDEIGGTERIPVIDMMNYPNPYLDKNQIGKVNAWEYFYKQPAGYNLGDICSAKNVILCAQYTKNKVNCEDEITKVLEYDNCVRHWAEIYHKYIKLNDRLNDIVKKNIEQLFCVRGGGGTKKT